MRILALPIVTLKPEASLANSLDKILALGALDKIGFLYGSMERSSSIISPSTAHSYGPNGMVLSKVTVTVSIISMPLSLFT
jgi:hypothetical protein